MKTNVLLALALFVALGAALLLNTGSAQATTPTPNIKTIVLGSGSAAAFMTAAGDSPLAVVPTTAEHFTGSGSWNAVLPNGGVGSAQTFEFYIDPTVAPFDNLGAFTIKQVASISYHTKKGTPQTAVDFGMYFYTVPCVGGDASWYCHRLSAEPYLSASLNAPANTWNTWTTDAGTNQLRFFDNGTPTHPRTVQGWYNEPTLQDLQAGPLNWGNYAGSGSSATVDYSNETVKYVRFNDSISWGAFNGYLDGITITLTNGNSLTIDLESATLAFQPDAAYVGVGSNIPVNINLDAVNNLYGYQFKVHYDSTKVSAAGVFVNTIFDTTTNAYVTWGADCTTPGVCEFAVTKQNAIGVNPVNVNGTIAQITFTATNPGTVPLTFSDDILSDKDAHPLVHSSSAGALNVYGFATVNGTVNLQGRSTPIDQGTVTFSDQGSIFPPTVVNFSATDGTFTASVPVLSTGSTYNLLAAHSLYLSNQLIGASAFMSGNTYSPAITRLLGGDANNDGKIYIEDLTCIGGAFGGAPTNCGGTGSSDINADSTVNILDLVLAGGNYELASPQPWTP